MVHQDQWKFSLLLFHAPILTFWSTFLHWFWGKFFLLHLSITLNCLKTFWVRQIKKLEKNNHRFASALAKHQFPRLLSLLFVYSGNWNYSCILEDGCLLRIVWSWAECWPSSFPGPFSYPSTSNKSFKGKVLNGLKTSFHPCFFFLCLAVNSNFALSLFPLSVKFCPRCSSSDITASCRSSSQVDRDVRISCFNFSNQQYNDRVRVAYCVIVGSIFERLVNLLYYLSWSDSYCGAKKLGSLWNYGWAFELMTIRGLAIRINVNPHPGPTHILRYSGYDVYPS